MGMSTNTANPPVPKGYKRTEVGVIPEDWVVLRFSDHFVIYAGGDVPKDSFSQTQSEKFPFPIYANAIKNKGLYGFTNYKRANPDSFTVTARGYLGHAEYREKPFFPIVRLLVFEPVGSLDAKYTTYAVNERVKFSIESTGVPQLTAPQVAKYTVAAPPTLAEQRAIAEALSDVDGLIEALEKLIAKKRAIKQTTMQQLLTGETRLPGFEEEWVTLNMARNSYLKARIGWQGLTTAEYLETGDFGLVTGTDFVDGKIDWEGCHFVEKVRYDQDKYIQLKLGDVLLTKDGTIGKATYVDVLPFPTTLNSGVFVVRPLNDAYIPKYFYYILMSRVFSDFLNKLTAGSTISHLYQKDFVGFEFSAPPTKEEQSALADVLSDMDAEIGALEKRRDKTREIKKGMMEQLLTGRVRLVNGETMA